MTIHGASVICQSSNGHVFVALWYSTKFKIITMAARSQGPKELIREMSEEVSRYAKNDTKIRLTIHNDIMIHTVKDHHIVCMLYTESSFDFKVADVCLDEIVAKFPYYDIPTSLTPAAVSKKHKAVLGGIVEKFRKLDGTTLRHMERVQSEISLVSSELSDALQKNVTQHLDIKQELELTQNLSEQTRQLYRKTKRVDLRRRCC